MNDCFIVTTMLCIMFGLFLAFNVTRKLMFTVEGAIALQCGRVLFIFNNWILVVWSPGSKAAVHV